MSINIELLQKRIKFYEEQQNIRKQGKWAFIPFQDILPNFSRFIPGVEKGIMTLITANSGVGKSSLAKFLYIFAPYVWCKNNPEQGIRYRCIYFALEESKEEFIDSVVLMYLYVRYGHTVDHITLRSSSSVLTDEILGSIKSAENEIADFLSCIDIVDTVTNPTGLFKHVESYAKSVGTEIFETVQKRNGETIEIFKHYEEKDPNLYTVIITDNLNLINGEYDRLMAKTLNKREAIEKYSYDYCRMMMSKRWRFPVVNIQQQAADSEKPQFTNKGENIIEKAEPSLDGLGDVKTTQRDHLVVLGLFDPSRLKVDTYRGYRIDMLQDSFRSLSILKNRYGAPNKKFALEFTPASCFFHELEHPSKIDYNKYK